MVNPSDLLYTEANREKWDMETISFQFQYVHLTSIQVSESTLTNIQLSKFPTWPTLLLLVFSSFPNCYLSTVNSDFISVISLQTALSN